MSPYKIKYRVITAKRPEDAATDSWFDDYDKALEFAGEYLSDSGCAIMDLVLFGPRGISGDGNSVLYKQEIFSAMKSKKV